MALNWNKQIRLVRICLLGFSNGIPLFLTSKTLALWLSDFGVSYSTIGALSIVSLPHALSFLWAPFLDFLPLPFFTQALGQRRGWLVFTQISLILSIIALSLTDPWLSLTQFGLCALLIAFTAATQETLVLAYQMESLSKDQYGPGEAIGILGYRIGMLTSGAGAIYLSQFMAWPTIYFTLSLSIFVGFFTALFSPEPTLHRPGECHVGSAKEKRRFRSIIRHPFQDFIKQKNSLWILLLIFLFNMGDNFFGNFTNIFYVELNISREHIANATKICGMLATIVGGLVGGSLVYRLGFLKSLMIFGSLHACSNLLYLVMLRVGDHLPWLYFTTTVEHFTAGMRTAALFSYQMIVCNVRFAASQLSLLTSVYSFSRTFFSFFSGLILAYLGWDGFIIVVFLSAIPGLCIVSLLIKRQTMGPLIGEVEGRDRQ